MEEQTAQQQVQAQQVQVHFANMCKDLSSQVAGLATTMGAQGVAKIIKTFDGEGKQFKEWVKSIEKYAVLNRVPTDQVRMVSY